MRISDEQVKRVLSQRQALAEVQEPDLEGEPTPRVTDGPMIKAITRDVMEMADREDRVAELKAMIDAGEYNPTGDEIADAMIRRSIADRMR